MARGLKRRAVHFLAAALLLSAATGGAGAAEREEILSFVSRITVHRDATVTITETIRVRSTGHQIKRGIYRDFPTTYRDRFGNTVRVGFQVLRVTRDGRPLPYWVEKRAGGERVYMGRKGIYIRPGVYTFGLTYQTDHQIGYFKDFDELYWNVTGNDWRFPIRHAVATVRLPHGARALQTAAYTGPRGAKGTDFTITAGPDGTTRFATTRALGPGEGLTVAVAWPKGLVREPTGAEKAAFLLSGNLNLIAALAGLLVVGAYYYFTWSRVGRDPEAGTVVPLFAPPEGFSPAATRVVREMGFDDTAFAAAIVSMAVKGYLKITDDDGTYALTRTADDGARLSRGEKALAKELFDGGPAVRLTRSNHTQVGVAREALADALKGELESVYFNTNRLYLVPGALLSVVTAVLVALMSSNRFDVGFMATWLAIWTFACARLVMQAGAGWARARRGGTRPVLAAVGATVFAIPFLIGEAVGLYHFTGLTSLPTVLVLLAIALLSPIFYYLLKAPTLKGRRILDQIEGFELYLSVAEKDRLDVLNPPEETADLFEKYLPYALALGVENQWGARFEGRLSAAGEAYEPSWYVGRPFGTGSLPDLGRGLGGALTGALATASTSSGSGGGGFSGGGGGGGGGGGF